MTLSAPAEACIRADADVVRPDRRRTIAEVDHGQAGRELMEAVFEGDVGRAGRLLDGDPRLRDTRAPQHGLVAVAVGRCDRPMIEALLARGVPPDPGAAPVLGLALAATDPWFAVRLLDAGVPARPDARGYDPMRDAIALGSAGAVRLLLDRGYPIDHADALGGTPLQAAIYMEQLPLAEVLVERGANIWAIDAQGVTVGEALNRPALTDRPANAQPRARLIARLQQRGFPWPPPTPQQGRALLRAGTWPPAGKGDGYRPPDAVTEAARQRGTAGTAHY